MAHMSDYHCEIKKQNVTTMVDNFWSDRFYMVRRLHLLICFGDNLIFDLLPDVRHTFFAKHVAEFELFQQVLTFISNSPTSVLYRR